MTQEPSAAFPVAKIESRAARWRAILAGSRMWWVTLLCLIVAGVLVWQSIEPAGPQITIHFPEGHGLAVGDRMRHRGIDVGEVNRVDLHPDLSGVVVEVTLLPGAESLAREGAEFWIVRPRISLTEVSGLETAVGAKYIAVNPPPPEAAPAYEFDGLAAAPPGELGARGIEIVLRGADAYGLNPGSPITWRGVPVGEVLSIGLAIDTRYVDVRARIDDAYRNLVRSNARFWVTSGVGIDASLLRLSVRAESLTTIARGGVSFITPADGAPDEPVSAGHVFELHPERDKKWVDAASTVSLIDFPLPPTIIVRAVWKEKQLGFTRNRERSIPGVLIAGEVPRKFQLIAPADALQAPAGAIADSWQIRVFSAGNPRPIFTVPQDVTVYPLPGDLASCRLEAESPLEQSIPESRVRVATVPEDCCLVRSVDSAGGPSSVIESISRTQLTPASDTWLVDHADRDLDDWHGAAVVATSDGAALGLFLAASEGPRIALFRSPPLDSD